MSKHTGLYRQPDSLYWWMSYTNPITKKRVRVSTGEVLLREAKKVRASRIAALTEGRAVPEDLKRVYLGDYDEATNTATGLCGFLLDRYRRRGNRSTRNAFRSWHNHIARLLSPERDATRLTYAAFAKYDADRAEELAAPATRRGELALVRAAMHEAKRAGALPVVPEFPAIEVHNTREGFLRDGDFGALMTVLPVHLRAPVHWAFIAGWRKEEVLGMTWDMVDRDAGEIRLPWRHDKAKAIRPVPYSAHPDLDRIIEEQWAKADATHRKTGRPVDTVFFYEDTGPRRRLGNPIKEPKGAWNKARTQAGLGGLTIHDLKRTAVRNLERAGVSRSVAMSIVGHKTESIYKRYAIVDEQSQREGLKKLANFMDNKTAAL